MGTEQKVVVITGASQGIGAALVEAYRDRGYRIVAIARSIKRSDDTDVLAVPGDVADRKTAERAIAEGVALVSRTLGTFPVGPYQLQAPLGRGGMGMVYLAFDARSRQHVALKILSPRKARLEERYLTRFRREMELSQRVSHRHIAWQGNHCDTAT